MSKTKLSVVIRMYKVGELGDCFLLRFKEGDRSSNVLIDCGSFRNAATSVQRLNNIWKNITDELGQESLDVVVATHQHNDHVSGFVHGKKQFKSLHPQQVWLSWLDDPRDSKARAVKKEHEKVMANLVKLAEKASATAFSNSGAISRMREVIEFATNLNNAPAIPTEGLSILKNVGQKKTRYLEPGEILSLPGIEESVKVFVLGPPKADDMLKDIHSSSTETYDHRLAAANAQSERLITAFSNFSHNGDDAWEEMHFPFTDHYKIPVDEFATRSEDCKQVYESYQEEEWRKIDDDWLDEAGSLALYMDRYTNNTSLVLAFQLVQSGTFMLFVGDAQTGNWNSWKSIKWKNAPDRFTLNDLLNNTIFYKVGHHCSHNATLVEGLEAMTHEDLVAMIPVDVSDPNITKDKGWKMPAKNLYKRLKEKTKNRLMRMDTGFAEDCEPQEKNGKKFWSSLGYEHEVKNEPLYVQHQMMI